MNHHAFQAELESIVRAMRSDGGEREPVAGSAPGVQLNRRVEMARKG